MAQDFPFIRHFIHSLAVHHGGSPWVASSRHRFTLSLALPFHPIDYVSHQLLLLLPLLLPVWPLSDLSGHVSQFSPLLTLSTVRSDRLIDKRGGEKVGGRVRGLEQARRSHACWGGAIVLFFLCRFRACKWIIKFFGLITIEKRGFRVKTENDWYSLNGGMEK